MINVVSGKLYNKIINFLYLFSNVFSSMKINYRNRVIRAKYADFVILKCFNKNINCEQNKKVTKN